MINILLNVLYALLIICAIFFVVSVAMRLLKCVLESIMIFFKGEKNEKK